MTLPSERDETILRDDRDDSREGRDRHGNGGRLVSPVRSTVQTMRLLIIEDDRDAADYLVKAFREVGHVADRATDGEEGLALALEGQYDVLIVDRMLP